ncbi:gamma-glutamylcyclotransferase family protein [Actinokineospora diospyrosa]|uniref:Conserved protein YtfP, gamma-glutamylcyclotransferase (GGCT)/AIG2-like family n=1 Tax=Actinokineospora diospyrosa TaxID=103728 RepID=A0ABT1IGJ8_9PSEU|nr:gamma-glutamylcyclotransferase family protein [Actinokineospora diospyrosa]MCP2271768.1 putative conserved protein YtfP, gamma-glutamylcyclotransferase (GGCT)/AIG2-like family [Actinokineospora diospyrosa]
MTSFDDTEYPAAPYPGARPPFSYVYDDAGWEIKADQTALSGWRVGDEDLDGWLGERGWRPMAQRVPVLAYGSNPNPSKLAWLKSALGLTGAVVVLRARCEDIAAVWASGLRVVDDQRPVTLTALPGAVEDHAVMMLTQDQVAVLDVCEGRGDRYNLARVSTGRVTLSDSGAILDRVLAYVAASDIRKPLLVNGSPVRCADVPQEAAIALTGQPAATDGLAVEILPGAPDPGDYPGSLFVYGTLRPGDSHWHLLAPQSSGPARDARLTGSLYDTGYGYPALALGEGPGVHGSVVPLREGADLAEVDAYEGERYARMRVVLADGTFTWTYVWIAPVAGMSVLTGPWRPRS